MKIYKTMISPVVSNRMLRRVFGAKRDEMVDGWRKLHTEDLHDMYFSPYIIE
jgi:hypothetical protein